MKKTIILLFCLATFKVGFAQWTAIDSNNVNTIWLVQPNDGWAFGNDFRNWDGTNWTTVLQDSAFGAEACAFTAPDEGWVFGWYQDSLYRYNGSVWTKQYSGMAGIRYCDFFDSNHGWAFGSDTTYYYQNGIWTTYPITLTVPISLGPIRSISASDTNTAWMIGGVNFGYPNNDTSYILKFSSGQWAVDTAFSNVNLYSISFTDENHGWACGWDVGGGWLNVIYKYNGSSWALDTILGASPDGNGYIYMFNNNLGWVSFSTASGYLVYGYNGSSWSYQCALEIPVKQFSFVDPLDGWALGLLIGHPSSGPPNMIFNTTSGGLGDEEFNLPESPEINIFPNPATDKISITCLHKQNLRLSVYNVIGALILTKELFNTKDEIDISNFSKGIYIFKIASEDRAVMKKIVKE
ncbi:MAG TPA: T9SS type A sorting domain-containing protein [Bacteroidales bacterium]|nr:T9SS type A sorting domain-containing protein [Bacteroidales bacterium]HQI70026.1 T9SS type A sorting domain-containing protein [Bacteroidales bacterium]